MCNLLITLYLPFSISDSKVIASHIISKLQQKGFIYYIRTPQQFLQWFYGCDKGSFTRYRTTGIKKNQELYRCIQILSNTQRIINSIFISWFYDEQPRSNNYLGFFFTAMRIKSVSLNHWHVAEYFHLNFFYRLPPTFIAYLIP
jgi:hypothetical protein